MRTTSSSVAVFFWTLRRRWKGFAIFVCATVAVNSLIISVYPEFSGLRDEAIAEALGGDIEISLTQPNADDGSYVVAWGKHNEADGYALIESDADIPLTLITSAGLSEINLQLLATFLPSAGRTSGHSPSTSSRRRASTRAGGRDASRAPRWPRSNAIPGRETSGSWRTPLNTGSRCPTATSSM